MVAAPEKDPRRAPLTASALPFFDGAAATGPALTLAWGAAQGLGALLLGNALKARVEAAAPTTGRELAPVG